MKNFMIMLLAISVMLLSVYVTVTERRKPFDELNDLRQEIAKNQKHQARYPSTEKIGKGHQHFTTNRTAAAVASTKKTGIPSPTAVQTAP